MFKNPRSIGHISFALVIIGLIIHSVAKYFFDGNELLIGLSLAFYFGAFPFSILAIMRNWRVPKEKRLELWSTVEVGVGLLPFFITVVLVAYALWFVG